MATTTLEVLRQEFSARFGLTTPEAEEWSTSQDIATTTAVRASTLRDAGYDDYGAAASGDDVFQGQYIYIKGTNNALVTRRIKSYDASSGEITVTGAALANESGSQTFEIHKVHPSRIHNALNAARFTAYPYLYQPEIDETLFTGQQQHNYDLPSNIIDKPHMIKLIEPLSAQQHPENLLSNGGFEDGVTSWTASNLTAAAESSENAPTNVGVLMGSGSAKITSTASTAGTLLQSISSPTTHAGLKLNLSVWVYCLTASRVTARIKVDSSNNDGSGDRGTHQGKGWQKLSVSVDLEPSNPASFTLDAGVQVTAASGQITFFVDEAILTVGQVGVQSQEGEMLLGWKYNEWVDSDGSTTRRIHITDRLPDRYMLQIHGHNYLSAISGEGDVMQIGGPQTELLYAQAGIELFRSLMHEGAVSQRAQYGTLLEDALAARRAFARQYAMPQPAYINGRGRS